MSKIAVNWKRYVTCRLCLEEQGAYTILPNIKDQIEYCFGIDIQPFDRMPQLICEKCENILSNYSQLKKKYIDNQDTLKTKIYQCESINEQAPAPCEAPASPQINKKDKTTQNRKRRIISTSSDEASNNTSLPTRKKRLRTYSKESMKSTNTTPKGYDKKYVCRICNTRWSNVLLVTNHVKNKHGHLYKKYGHIIRKHCYVSIPKTDLGNPDHGFADNIMFSKDKIMKNVRGAYFITYTSRNYKDDSRPGSALSSRSRLKRIQRYSESTDLGDVCTLRRRRSGGSESSTDIVNLESKPGVASDNEAGTKSDLPPPMEAGDCITLDSSDNESLKSDSQRVTKKSSPILESKTLNEIVNTCIFKYHKKHILDNLSLKSAKNPSEVATQLKRKVLSIGRKIINKKIAIKTTPLARFLENKPLDVVWCPRASSQDQDANSEANYVRILTRTCQPGEKENVDTETGWSWHMSAPAPGVARASGSEPLPARPSIVLNGINGHLNGIQVLPASMPELTAMLQDNTGAGKLLNANPVANPKQLPRKYVVGDVTLSAAGVSPQEPAEESCMPIITSTTSLAVSQADEVELPSIPDTPTEVPRIKVKPVSELMSAATLQRMKEPTTTPVILAAQNSNVSGQAPQVAIPAGSYVFIPRVTAGPLPPAPAPAPAPAPEPAWDFLVLNTTELPNKRTSSPFLYIRMLLQLHDIILQDTQADLNDEFHCLIKFKVVYKQENHNPPVVLCISLHCANKVFCFKIKDRNHENIDLAKITAHWQWEVFKTFKGEVVPKVLAAAQKISSKQFEYTNKFLCLLKSIDLVL